MTRRPFPLATATIATALAITACGSMFPPQDLTGWAADKVPVPAEGGFSMANITDPRGGHSSYTANDIQPGWYAVTMACAPTDTGAAPEDRSTKIVLKGENGPYGGGDCAATPITTTVYIGVPDEPAPETISVEVMAVGHEYFWGLSASPTTAP
ncbi:hypothetical protein [Kocuria sp. KH4]